MNKLEEEKQEDRGGDKEGEEEKEKHSYWKHKPCNIFVNS